MDLQQAQNSCSSLLSLDRSQPVLATHCNLSHGRAHEEVQTAEDVVEDACFEVMAQEGPELDLNITPVQNDFDVMDTDIALVEEEFMEPPSGFQIQSDLHEVSGSMNIEVESESD